jgi:hypothetical protein
MNLRRAKSALPHVLFRASQRGLLADDGFTASRPFAAAGG